MRIACVGECMIELSEGPDGLVRAYGGDTLKVTASLGVAVFPRHGASLAALMQDVDQALYRAKDAGRNTVETVQKL